MGTEKKVSGTWTLTLRRRWYVPVIALALALGLPGLGHVTGREPGTTWIRLQLPDPPAPLPDHDRPGTGVSVAVTAMEDSWVELESDGSTAFAKILHAGQTQTVGGVDRVLLVSGNAAGIAVSFNGKSIGPLGGPGQRRIVNFSAGGFQLLARRS